MKDWIGSTLFALFLAVWFGPWVIGLLDLGAWALTGSQLTAIPWNSGRGMTLIFWPFGFTFLATIFWG